MTTNNNPAHGPVSLDRLHQIREILSKASAQSDGGNLGYAMADAVKVIEGAIAAFGAEPVADVVAWSSPNEERTCDIRLRRHDIAPGPLYTTPPAPVVDSEPVAWWTGPEPTPTGEIESIHDHETGSHIIPLYHSRAAMLQAEPVSNSDELPPSIKPAPELDSMIKNAGFPPGNSPVNPDCSCRTCRPVTFTDSRFVVCPECGNKRCPHANDHRNACTGSNEPGQEGSTYPAAPQQEVK
ncbi:hypothetical protein AII44_05660 [Salmonella enterica]|uniref:hypothetical protein n=2 Tax=Citrobacter freundii complex TaxID=1344959 RepID=UPI001289DD65|nr:hypothetical protein [Salmonella enterica]EBG8167831.1 hypothetical protein [Salmonella enterica subsp. enterica serovar Agona]EBW3913229.1 hypothetical protein [Salmonella enterica subsp. enterica serovar Agona]EBZ6574193.1 hypothetical protein [Salmonella enterica subsp. enterica serovar Agona]ECA2885297.1 hypothetical protein [Salmonella enterica subsp. enterica serovar Agona]